MYSALTKFYIDRLSAGSRVWKEERIVAYNTRFYKLFLPGGLAVKGFRTLIKLDAPSGHIQLHIHIAVLSITVCVFRALSHKMPRAIAPTNLHLHTQDRSFCIPFLFPSCSLSLRFSLKEC